MLVGVCVFVGVKVVVDVGVTEFVGVKVVVDVGVTVFVGVFVGVGVGSHVQFTPGPQLSEHLVNVIAGASSGKVGGSVPLIQYATVDPDEKNAPTVPPHAGNPVQ